jgi:L-ascorbate metabolism protein UlaG (beta-lactamase superfamily)
LEHWGFAKEMIIEKDWNEEIVLGNDFIVNTTPARHFSGGVLKDNSHCGCLLFCRHPP